MSRDKVTELRPPAEPPQNARIAEAQRELAAVCAQLTMMTELLHLSGYDPQWDMPAALEGIVGALGRIAIAVDTVAVAGLPE